MNMTDINVCSHPAVSSGSRTLSGARLAAPAAWAFPGGVGEAGQADGTTSSSSQTVTLRATYQPSPRFLFFSWKVCAAIFILKSPYNWKVPTNRSTSSCFPMVPPKLGWEHWNAGRQRPVAWAGPRAGLGAAAGRGQGDAPRTRPPASGFHPVRLFRAPGPSSRSFRELRGRQNSGNDQPLLHNDRCSCLNFQWV